MTSLRPRGARRLRSRALPFVLASALGGCTLGPDFSPPPAPPTSGYTPEALGHPQGARQRFAVGRDVPGRWWRLYGSRDLNLLVEACLAANPSIEAAQATLRGAREAVEAQRATLFPQIGLGGQATRQRITSDLSTPLANSNSYTYNLYTPQLGATFTPDLWGGGRRQVEALGAEAENQRFQLEAAYLALIGNVIGAAIQEASLRGQIASVREVIRLQGEILETYRTQQNMGQGSGADVAQQEAALAQSQQLLPPLEKQLAQNRNLLAALAGRFPAEGVRQGFTLSSLRLPTTLPVSLPANLVRQRPDVRAAEASLHAASAGIGVAIANRFPQLTLSADAGLSATRIAALGAPGTQFYTLAAAATQPIFDAGNLFRKQRVAEEAFHQADAQYRATVIAALQNVADALRAVQADARASAAAHSAVAAARKSVELTRVQLRSGAVPPATLLIAQQYYLQALLNDVQAQAAQLSDTVQLFQALGGGWWNRVDVTPKEDAVPASILQTIPPLGL
ncbi:efflux transporter outer membrane subunit [Enterovirga sp.]|uniref:efflux transporter outer membrane subunit n=1 Tax=Enterovirga sp. TaxID=2026350 RepID=UPI002C205A39|nr:efflux transporter outer membrane subunit [Enterovirga sp.]HMO29923.1 efflux transporter outer membrane subunit [Enterovirga sp.]